MTDQVSSRLPLQRLKVVAIVAVIIVLCVATMMITAAAAPHHRKMRSGRDARRETAVESDVGLGQRDEDEHPDSIVPQSLWPHSVPDSVKRRAAANRQHIIDLCGSVDNFPPFNPALWDDGGVRRYSNCYCYALSELNKKYHHKLQPGEIAGMGELGKGDLTCDRLRERVLRDHPSIIDIGDGGDCPCNTYEVGLVLANEGPEDEHDYHFYRIMRSGSYSHKPGSAGVSLVDASNNYIVDGHAADWDYSKHDGPNYRVHCTRFCVPHLQDQTFSDEAHPTDHKFDQVVPTVNSLPHTLIG
jgi:hypothetical protein